VVGLDGSVSTVLDSARFLEIRTTNEVANEPFEIRRPRLLARRGLWRIECPDGSRLFAFQDNNLPRAGLLFVPVDGAARIVFESNEHIDAPLSMSGDHSYVAFADEQRLYVVRLDGGTFASTSLPWRSVLLADSVEPASVAAGATCAFCVLGNGHVVRVPYSDGALPEDITPAGSASHEQAPSFAVAAEGTTVAFLRGPDTDNLTIWVAHGTGEAAALVSAPRRWRMPSYLPEGTGDAWLVLSHDGSLLMATEAGVEDELFVFDTAVASVSPVHVTANAQFAEYIGAHVLPGFIAGNLVFAAGHAGQMDWYRSSATGYSVNLTQTGAPNPPYLVGSLDAKDKIALVSGAALVTDRVGPYLRARVLDEASGSPTLIPDLVEPPRPGSSTNGGADLRLIGETGEFLVSGHNGDILISLPAGISLSDPVRGPGGITVVYASLTGGPGLIAVLLPDGTFQAGPAFVSQPPFAVDDSEILWVVDGDSLHAYWANQHLVIGLGSASAPHRLLSGAGS